jgi:hypothetical protein
MKENELNNRIMNQIKKAHWAEKAPYFELGAQEDIQIHVRPDTTVALGMFKPHPFMQGMWIAHPTTIRAMRKDLFLVSDGFEEFENLYTCRGCCTEIDLQYWLFCPYCETSFSNDATDLLKKSTERKI